MPDTDHVGWGCGEGVGGVSGVKPDRGVLIRGALIGTSGCTCGGGVGGGWSDLVCIVEYQWILHGLSMDLHGNPWVING